MISKLKITFIITTLIVVCAIIQDSYINNEIGEYLEEETSLEENNLMRLSDVVGKIDNKNIQEKPQCFDEAQQKNIHCHLLIKKIRSVIYGHVPKDISTVRQLREKILNIKKAQEIQVSPEELLTVEELAAITLENLSAKDFLQFNLEEKNNLISKYGGLKFLRAFYLDNIMDHISHNEIEEDIIDDTIMDSYEAQHTSYDDEYYDDYETLNNDFIPSDEDDESLIHREIASELGENGFGEDINSLNESYNTYEQEEYQREYEDDGERYE